MSDTVFNKVDYTLGALLGQIELGQLGLPDIQRPFVWKNAKVRDLFDSLYRGYPVGYFLFWATSADGGAKQIGADSKQVAPTLLIVDGQQRLTGLYAVIKGAPVVLSPATGGSSFPSARCPTTTCRALSHAANSSASRPNR